MVVKGREKWGMVVKGRMKWGMVVWDQWRGGVGCGRWELKE